MSSVFGANPLRGRASRPRLAKFIRPAGRFVHRRSSFPQLPPLKITANEFINVGHFASSTSTCPRNSLANTHLASGWIFFLSKIHLRNCCPLSSSWLRNEPDATHILNLFLFCCLQRRLLQSPGVPLCHFDTLSMRLSCAGMNVSQIGKYSPNPQTGGVSSKNFHSDAKVVSPAKSLYLLLLVLVSTVF